MGRPRAKRPHVPRPSPLQQVHHSRPLSQVPDVAAPPAASLVRDPHFWKRFSVAVHMAEVPGDVEKGSQKGSSSSVVGSKDEWLAQQHREKRRWRIMCTSITMVVALVIVAAAIVGWYFTKVKKI